MSRICQIDKEQFVWLNHGIWIHINLNRFGNFTGKKRQRSTGRCKVTA